MSFDLRAGLRHRQFRAAQHTVILSPTAGDVKVFQSKPEGIDFDMAPGARRHAAMLVEFFAGAARDFVQQQFAVARIHRYGGVEVAVKQEIEVGGGIPAVGLGLREVGVVLAQFVARAEQHGRVGHLVVDQRLVHPLAFEEQGTGVLVHAHGLGGFQILKIRHFHVPHQFAFVHVQLGLLERNLLLPDAPGEGDFGVDQRLRDAEAGVVEVSRKKLFVDVLDGRKAVALGE